MRYLLIIMFVLVMCGCRDKPEHEVLAYNSDSFDDVTLEIPCTSTPYSTVPSFSKDGDLIYDIGDDYFYLYEDGKWEKLIKESDCGK